MSENLSLKQTIFRELSAEVSPSTILASNTSSISITKIAASTIRKGSSAADEAGKRSASRVVGMVAPPSAFRLKADQSYHRPALLQSCPSHGMSISVIITLEILGS